MIERTRERSVLHTTASAEPTVDGDGNLTVTVSLGYEAARFSSAARTHLTQGAAWDLLLELTYALRGLRHP